MERENVIDSVKVESVKVTPIYSKKTEKRKGRLSLFLSFFL